ncbi:cyclase family protein [Acidaminobacter sp. JC074]|uniref:cyclase family protein n=1 Tax=Acidaminobacter sp. JC074 TaxID=2530199 RepID=UPI001F11562A|nr:cyclase family protein [Acidaminobacter sp. JC074]
MIDITMTVKESMKVYKNKAEKKPKFTVVSDKPVYETDLSINLHTGTHIDFPKHMIPDGKTSKDYGIDHFVGKAYVVDVTFLNRRILKKDITSINLSTYDFIIFKTKNSFSEAFNPEFVYLSEEAADYLSKSDIKGVGIDGLGIEREQAGHPTHKLLLSKDILIYEGLDLSQVEEGVYEFVGLPLKIDDVEASLVRAILR